MNSSHKNQQYSTEAQEGHHQQLIDFFCEFRTKLDQGSVTFLKKVIPLEEERTKLGRREFGIILEYIRQVLSYFVATKEELETSIEKKEIQECSDYESCLQKLEAEVRMHIRVQQQLKLLAESTQEKAEQSLKEKQESDELLKAAKEEVKACQENISQLQEKISSQVSQIQTQQTTINQLSSQIQQLQQSISEQSKQYEQKLQQSIVEQQQLQSQQSQYNDDAGDQSKRNKRSVSGSTQNNQTGYNTFNQTNTSNTNDSLKGQLLGEATPQQQGSAILQSNSFYQASLTCQTEVYNNGRIYTEPHISEKIPNKHSEPRENRGGIDRFACFPEKGYKKESSKASTQSNRAPSSGQQTLPRNPTGQRQSKTHHQPSSSASSSSQMFTQQHGHQLLQQQQQLRTQPSTSSQGSSQTSSAHPSAFSSRVVKPPGSSSSLSGNSAMPSLINDSRVTTNAGSQQSQSQSRQHSLPIQHNNHLQIPLNANNNPQNSQNVNTNINQYTFANPPNNNSSSKPISQPSQGSNVLRQNTIPPTNQQQLHCQINLQNNNNNTQNHLNANALDKNAFQRAQTNFSNVNNQQQQQTQQQQQQQQQQQLQQQQDPTELNRSARQFVQNSAQAKFGPANQPQRQNTSFEKTGAIIPPFMQGQLPPFKIVAGGVTGNSSTQPSNNSSAQTPLQVVNNLTIAPNGRSQSMDDFSNLQGVSVKQTPAPQQPSPPPPLPANNQTYIKNRIQQSSQQGAQIQQQQPQHQQQQQQTTSEMISNLMKIYKMS